MVAFEVCFDFLSGFYKISIGCLVPGQPSSILLSMVNTLIKYSHVYKTIDSSVECGILFIKI